MHDACWSIAHGALSISSIVRRSPVPSAAPDVPASSSFFLCLSHCGCAPLWGWRCPSPLCLYTPAAGFGATAASWPSRPAAGMTGTACAHRYRSDGGRRRVRHCGWLLRLLLVAAAVAAHALHAAADDRNRDYYDDDDRNDADNQITIIIIIPVLLGS